MGRPFRKRSMRSAAVNHSDSRLLPSCGRWDLANGRRGRRSHVSGHGWSSWWPAADAVAGDGGVS